MMSTNLYGGIPVINKFQGKSYIRKCRHGKDRTKLCGKCGIWHPFKYLKSWILKKI